MIVHDIGIVPDSVGLQPGLYLTIAVRTGETSEEGVFQFFIATYTQSGEQALELCGSFKDELDLILLPYLLL